MLHTLHFAQPQRLRLPTALLLQAVEEGMVSRIYAGVHYRRAVNVGRDIGEAVGAYVWSSPGPRPSTVTSSAFALDDTD